MGRSRDVMSCGRSHPQKNSPNCPGANGFASSGVNLSLSLSAHPTQSPWGCAFLQGVDSVPPEAGARAKNRKKCNFRDLASLPGIWMSVHFSLVLCTHHTSCPQHQRAQTPRKIGTMSKTEWYRGNFEVGMCFVGSTAPCSTPRAAALRNNSPISIDHTPF